MTRVRYRTSSNWRYRVIKHYKKRAEKFMREAESFEERRAWKKVIQWFDDILSRKYLNHNNAIGIPMVDISELNREEDLEK